MHAIVKGFIVAGLFAASFSHAFESPSQKPEIAFPPDQVLNLEDDFMHDLETQYPLEPVKPVYEYDAFQRSPAVEGPATDEPQGENAEIYENI